MRQPTIATFVSIALPLCLACTGHRAGAPRAATGSSATPAPAQAVEREEPGGGADPALARAVDRALARLLAGGERRGLRILAECGDDGGLTEVTVFGSGVGIWDRSRQFTLAADQVTALLERFRDAGFARFAELYGTIQQEVPVPDDAGQGEGGAASALEVVCRVALTVDGVTKQSSQLSKGPRSPELEALADAILAVGRAAGASGATAGDLEDGLAKIADGTLAPDVLRLLVHRKPGTGPGEEPGEGFLMRLEGSRATAQRFTPGAGYGELRVLDLEGAEVARLAALLAENRAGALPINLYASDYTDLAVEVLNRKTEIQARRFHGMTPRSHGEDQRRFDRLYRELAALAARALREGRPEPG